MSKKGKQRILFELKVLTGLILTEVFAKIAYAERGYVACGGEWLTLPLVFMLTKILMNVSNVIRYLFKTEGGYGSDED